MPKKIKIDNWEEIEEAVKNTSMKETAQLFGISYNIVSEHMRKVRGKLKSTCSKYDR